MFYTILVVANLACLALIGVLTGPAILQVLGVN
jgi:hypothetical protein